MYGFSAGSRCEVWVVKTGFHDEAGASPWAVVARRIGCGTLRQASDGVRRRQDRSDGSARSLD